MRSTMYASLTIMVLCITSLKTVRGSSASRYADKCKVYEINDHETSFTNAKATCERDGGMLGKISQQTVTDNFYAPLSQFLSSHIGGNCAWIGAKDRSHNREWFWTDDTPVSSVIWTIPPAYIFPKSRSILTCGRLCRGDSKWTWQPAECATALKFVCEYEDPDAEECVTACTAPASSKSPEDVNSGDPSRYVYGGKIFKIPDTEADFSNAMAFCERDGGRLAIINPEPATMMLNAPMSQFLDSRVGESCVFIGASDRENEGKWLWVDGTPTYSVLWTVDRNFHIILRFRKDCGRLCSDPKSKWLWQMDYCDISSEFVCEYEEPALETSLKPALKPKVKPMVKPIPTPVGKKGTRTVIVQLPGPKLIIGDPVLIKLAPMPTICSRFCLQTPNCDLFNFNVETHECTGYRRTSSVTYRESTKWTVWMLLIYADGRQKFNDMIVSACRTGHHIQDTREHCSHPG